MSVVSRFVNQSVLSPVQKIVNNVVGNVTAGAKSRVSSVASSISESLTEKGQSFQSVSSIAAQKVDSIIAGGSSDYAGFAGKDVTRASASDVINLRNTPGASKYSTEISPHGRIEAVDNSGNQLYDIYPSDIGRYKITFDFLRYNRPAAFAETVIDTLYSVTLPIPPELHESYSLNWETSSAGTVGDVADAFTRGTGGISQAGIIGDTSGGVLAAADRLARNASVNIMGNNLSVPPEIVTTAEQLLGGTANPNITAAFRGPSDFRQHRFTWTFNPRSPDESVKIQNIIKSIRKHSLPRTMFQHNASILLYPRMVHISLQPEQYYDFKIAVVTDISVSYSQNGIPSFFANTKMPTFIQLSLTLKEIEYFVSDDAPAVSDAVAAASFEQTVDILVPPGSAIRPLVNSITSRISPTGGGN